MQPADRSVGMVGLEARDRTTEGFQRLATPELGPLYTLARRLVGREGAEDLVQETLLRAYRSFDGLEDAEATGRWLKSIMVNTFRDGLRKRARSVDELPVE